MKVTTVGIDLAKNVFQERVPELIEDACNELPGSFRLLVQRLMEQLKELDGHGVEIEAQIAAWHRDNALSRKLSAVPGIGPITASALVATVGDAKNFANGRQLAAWLAALQLLQQRHRVQLRIALQQRHDLRFPHRGQRVPAGSPVASWLLGGQRLCALDATRAALADARLGGGATWLSWLRRSLYLCTWWSVIFLPGIPWALA